MAYDPSNTLRNSPKLLMNSEDGNNSRKARLGPKESPYRMPQYAGIFEPDWVESARGNYVAIDSGEMLATVYQAEGSRHWQIVINHDGDGHFVQDERFADPHTAMQRTEEILGGASCKTKKSKR